MAFIGPHTKIEMIMKSSMVLYNDTICKAFLIKQSPKQAISFSCILAIIGYKASHKKISFRKVTKICQKLRMYMKENNFVAGHKRRFK